MLNVFQSNQMEHLAAVLGEVLETPLPSPDMPEWIGVQTQGLGIWLGMETARRLGIWANVYQPYPRALVEKIFQTVMGDRCPDTTRFEPTVLTWSIMSLLPEFRDRPEFRVLGAYLADDDSGLKQFQLASRVAEIFDRYAVYRPEMVLQWEQDLKDDLFPPEHQWQPILWRALVARHGASHVAVAAARFFDVMRQTPDCVAGLPPRIALFGISTLPPLYVKVLAGLPEHISVNLFLLNPSREYWAYIRSRREIILEVTRNGADEDAMDEALYLEEGHALLSSLGRVGRDFQCILEESADYDEPAGDLYVPPMADDRQNLLHHLQSDILNLTLRRSGGQDPLPVRPGDLSISVHACHGPMREVQVLHDRLLDIFQQAPGIAPHDVIVMVPDIGAYAPVIEAVFGSGATEEGAIPYTISDRGMTGDSPVIQAFLQVLRLARGRLPVQEVLDLLAMDSVRERFGLTVADMENARHWLLDAGVRWGMTASHREAYGQPSLNQNTWRFGLDRLLLGVAMPAENSGLYQDTLPYTGVEGKETEILGQVVEFCETLFQCINRLRQPHPPSIWERLCRETLDRMVATNPDNAYQHQIVRDALKTLAQTAAASDLSEPMTLDVVQTWLVSQFKQRPSVRGFLSGGVTFCNLLPMRSIPFKVVCLLGMNDGDYPRNQPAAGFDLMAAKPRIGDRSVRNDDRYLFLEALLSARERFMVFYMGQAIRDNAVLPPSTVVGELLDVIEEGYYLDPAPTGHGPADLRRHLVTHHPLQPFSPDYFHPGPARLFSYSKEFLAGARALSGPKRETPPFFTAPLGEDEAAVATIDLVALLQFFNMPVDYLLRHRLGMVLQDRVEEIEEREPLILAGLDRFRMGEYLLDGQLEGVAPDELLPLIRANGTLPMGTVGECVAEELSDQVAPIQQAVTQARTGALLAPLQVDLPIQGVRVTGEITDLWPSARITHTYGAVTERRKLALWISHLLLNCHAAAGGYPRASVLVGRGPHGVECYELGPVVNPADLLADLLAVYSRGLCTPLPFFPATSHAYAQAWLNTSEAEAPRRAMDAAVKKWHGGPWNPAAEGEGLGVQRVFGGMDPLGAEGTAPDLSFPALALRVFSPMISAEVRPEKAPAKGKRK